MNNCVYLIGCRAVGKSSIGLELAKRIGYDFLDTDTLIVAKKKSSVATIVKEEGWQGFRKLENEVLSELRFRQHCVVATGGGAILHRKIWQELKKLGQVVWLTAELAILCDRLRMDRNSESLRPSLTGKDICQELAEVLVKRNPLYRELADIVVDTGLLTVAEAVHCIEKQIRES
ncbi:MAG: shikimate kinase AroL [Proteobacteria bacterium]|nr:shikimate kinase AroL [Pseudomonadota bacterium]MBU1060129.1 shikimate kinase AroL [Pseudomonadota bacterium]